MGLILNIESATETCSVAVARDGHLLAFLEDTGTFQHSEKLTLLIRDVMKMCGTSLKETDAVAISSGPGSYTSLRVGVSVAQGICYAIDKPLIAVNTLESLAFAARIQQGEAENENLLYFPVIDARRMEVYGALFDAEGKEISPPSAIVVEPALHESWFSKGYSIVFCGNAAEKCRQIMDHPQARFLTLRCSATHMINLSIYKYKNNVFTEISSFRPLYLKPPGITTPKKIL